MRVLLLPTYWGGISHWRFEMPEKALRDAGVDVFCPRADQLEKKVAKAGSFRAWLKDEMPQYDLVHAGYSPHLEFCKALYEEREFNHVPVIVDVDDNINAVPTYNAGWRGFYPGSAGQRIAKTFLRHADHVTFSTRPLASALGYLAEREGGRFAGTVLENWVDPDTWDCETPPERALDKGVRIMLTGGKGRYGDWQLLREPLESLMRQYPTLRLFFLGATPDWVDQWLPSPSDPAANRAFYLQPTHNVPLFNKLVRYVSPDIMLSPTEKNDFNAAKSPLKFLESALAGATLVCTDFDTYSMVPANCCVKVNNTTVEWRDSIGALIDDLPMCRTIADRAKSWVLANADIKDHIMVRTTLYEQVVREAKCRLSKATGPVPESASVAS